MGRWHYVGKRHGKTVAMPYWTAPDSALDDPDEMTVWARKAIEAARRSGKV
jgi:DNA transformation protein